MRMWGGRFDEGPDARMADFTRSIDVDAELALDDIAGSIAHVRGLGRAGLLTEDEVATLERGLVSLRADVEAGRDRLGSGPRGRPPQPRDAAHRAGRDGRRQAPHRPVAQRPGRHGPPALDAAGDRPARRAGSSALERRARRPRRARRRGRPPRRDPHPARAAGAARPSPARLRRDAGARPRPARRRARRGSTCRRWARARWPARATRSTARRPPRSSASTASRATRSTPSRTATSSWRCSRRRRSRWSTCRGSPRSSPGGRTRGSASSASRTRSRPAAR